MVCWISNVVMSVAKKNILDEKEWGWLLRGGCGGDRVVG